MERRKVTEGNCKDCFKTNLFDHNLLFNFIAFTFKLRVFKFLLVHVHVHTANSAAKISKHFHKRRKAGKLCFCVSLTICAWFVTACYHCKVSVPCTYLCVISCSLGIPVV